jgi:hypothetical protein
MIVVADKMRPPTKGALLHGATGISHVPQWKSFPPWTIATLNPSGTRRNPLLNGLISKSSASPVLPHLGHRRCSTQLVIGMPHYPVMVTMMARYPATNGGPTHQCSTLPNFDLPGTRLMGMSLTVHLAQELPRLSVEKMHPRAGLARNTLVHVVRCIRISVQPMLDFHRCRRTGEKELGHRLRTTDPRRLTMI